MKESGWASILTASSVVLSVVAVFLMATIVIETLPLYRRFMIGNALVMAIDDGKVYRVRLSSDGTLDVRTTDEYVVLPSCRTFTNR